MKLSDIDLRLLRVFQAVAEAGGFAKAQGNLGISQPAISAQIAKLEDRLGLRLADRGPQGFSLTTEGVLVLQEANRLLASVDESADRLRVIGKAPTKRIRFGVVDCMVTDPNNPLVDHIRTLKHAHADLKIQIGIYDFLDCLTELRAEQLDIAIVGIAGNETIPSDLEAISLYQETSGLYCTPDHECVGIDNPEALKAALAEAEISAHSFVFNPIDQDLDPKLLDQSKGLAQDTIELSTYLALSGTHVGLIPNHYAQNWVEAGQLIRLAPSDYAIVSQFHALRLLSAKPDGIADSAWRQLKTT
ncbi:LysR family transcriptional regulator [Octadecabacter sp. CECT 8868]|uniref:LysR family transcriptional regulator n=1 Tax=Octadecabacter algicola TaxID=2909342 RepID=UPI001F3F1A4E|nr:LysR family transcriptional regulator [Octadecabacter algicola]MCF2904991.1 LysR family transcriptional regulator [Octadecabacter algicola]